MTMILTPRLTGLPSLTLPHRETPPTLSGSLVGSRLSFSLPLVFLDPLQTMASPVLPRSYPSMARECLARYPTMLYRYLPH